MDPVSKSGLNKKSKGDLNKKSKGDLNKKSKGDFVQKFPFANMVKVSKRFSSRILIARFLNYNLKNL